jgi:diketogulonate reductase-like aldo/keto reductase
MLAFCIEGLDVSNVIANGVPVPTPGFGTYGMQGPGLTRLIVHALRAGFRHIDTAQIYRNESDVGAAIGASGISRSEIFITTKVWVTNYTPQAFSNSVEESLSKLGTDYIDLLLLHWPSAAVPLTAQIEGLDRAVRAGKVRHIGVSNFNAALVREAIDLSDIPLITNQFELHPYINQATLIEATQQAGLAVTGYCGMAVGRVFSEPVLLDIASRKRRTVAQIVLRWLFQQDVICLSRSTDEHRITDNLAFFDFSLDESEMKAIHGLAAPGSRIVDPPGLAPQWDPTP